MASASIKMKAMASASILLIAIIVLFVIFKSAPEDNVSAPSHSKIEASDQLSPSREAEAKRSPELFLYVSLILMSIATLCSVIISFYLYRWRRRFLSDKPSLLMPEGWVKYFDSVGKKMKDLDTSFASNIDRIANETSENSEKIENMIETYMSLHKELDKKDSEIHRLKEGYDAEIFRKYLSRFIRIDQAIDECMHSKEEDPNILGKLKRLFEDALDECGVESFEPELGEDYRDAFGVADNPKKVETDDSEKNFKVAEVIESGYKLRNEIIRPSKVSIYHIKE